MLSTLICRARGHQLESESLFPTACPSEQWVRRCKRCGRYVVHDHGAELTMGKRDAMVFMDAYYAEIRKVFGKDATEQILHRWSLQGGGECLDS